MGSTTSIRVEQPTLANVKKSFKIPVWGWFLIALVSVIVVTVAIVVPLILTRKSNNNNPFISPAPSPSQAPVGQFPNVSTTAVLFLKTIPLQDGLVKSTFQFMVVENKTISLLQVGQNTQTGYYTISLVDGQAQGPAEIVSPSNFSFGADAFGTNTFTYSESLPNPNTWYECFGNNTASPVTECSEISWPEEKLLNVEFFTTSTWNGFASGGVTFSFQEQNDGSMKITAQSGEKVFTSLETTAPTLSAPLSNSILNLFSSNGQTHVTFGWAERFSNTVHYVTHLNDTAPVNVQSFKVDDAGETLLGASVTDQADQMVVLTSERLLVYQRNVLSGNVSFSLRDTLVFRTNFQPRTWAVDRTGMLSDDKIWCAVGSLNASLTIVPFNTQGRFEIDLAREVPMDSLLFNTAGPCAVQKVSQTILMLAGSDLSGNSATVQLDVSKI